MNDVSISHSYLRIHQVQGILKSSLGQFSCAYNICCFLPKLFRCQLTEQVFTYTYIYIYPCICTYVYIASEIVPISLADRRCFIIHVSDVNTLLCMYILRMWLKICSPPPLLFFNANIGFFFCKKRQSLKLAKNSFTPLLSLVVIYIHRLVNFLFVLDLRQKLSFYFIFQRKCQCIVEC